LIELNSEDGNDLAMMAEMGFFALRKSSYQMTVPRLLTLEKVKAAICKYAKTEDDEFTLHPEYLVTPMPFSEATILQHRLQTINDFDHYSNCSGRPCNDNGQHLSWPRKLKNPAYQERMQRTLPWRPGDGCQPEAELLDRKELRPLLRLPKQEFPVLFIVGPGRVPFALAGVF
jgi:hypothetical protein